jgi:putative mRNA 3-end processing factor
MGGRGNKIISYYITITYILMIELECLGGCREVGRSALLLNFSNETRILLDYGVKVESYELPRKARNVNALLLSHAHLDHCGFVPTLSCEMYETAATLEQAHLLLEDSIKVLKERGLPLKFTLKDIKKMKEVIVTYGQRFEIENVEVEVFDAGHIPGSSGFLLEYRGKKIFYTGDFKLKETRLLNGAHFDVEEHVDVLIMEATYAYQEHPPRKIVEEKLVRIIKETIERDGNVVIPVFAVGRAAEILLVLYEHNVKYPIYLDGMAKKAVEITLRYPELLKDHSALKRAMDRVIPIYTLQDRKLALKNPSIIVTTSGMLNGGPVVYFLKRLKNDERSSLVFTGFQVPGTPGREVLDKKVFDNGKERFEIKMDVHFLDFSAHAGREELLKLVKDLNPEKIVVVHSDYAEEFAYELREKGYRAIAPENGDVIEIV